MQRTVHQCDACDRELSPADEIFSLQVKAASVDTLFCADICRGCLDERVEPMLVASGIANDSGHPYRICNPTAREPSAPDTGDRHMWRPSHIRKPTGELVASYRLGENLSRWSVHLVDAERYWYPNDDLQRELQFTEDPSRAVIEMYRKHPERGSMTGRRHRP